MTEAPSNEGAFLVSATPHIGKAPVGEGVPTGGCGSPTHEPSGSSSGTWNLVWNCGRWLLEYQGSMI